MANNPPLVSVVLPFYNSKNTLDRAIQSIVNQSFIDLEVLLIDNASTDASSEVARKWVENDPRVRLYTEEKSGVVYAANRGLEKANGTYIARMDADDVSFSDRIERQVRFLENHQDVGLGFWPG